MKIVIATRNAGKVREIKELFKGSGLKVESLTDYPQIGEIPETGDTFTENALIKARAVHRITGGYVLADDSGLVCDDLQGAPGVYSARFAGENATDEDNNRLLIQKIQEVHDPSRAARYVCVLALIDPEGHETVVEEACEGAITMTPAGGGGFGYDPYFFVPEYHCTMAELPLEIKNRISHRGKALKKIKEILS